LPIFSEIFGSLLKTNVMIKFFNSFALFWVKKPNFFADFLTKIFLKS
jgi:hypothetical protein